MSDREQLIHELDQTPDILVREVLNFLLFIKSRTNQADTQETSPSPNPEHSNLPNYLSFIDQLNSEQQKAPRPYALCAGEFVVPKNFNEPLPEDILRDFE
ncbi:hypothetical protein APA_697 [Pseudanabaena sp. lw0831]|uniref:hypothetical protein n=1 Tax=Pseudanabaena sp. lw0831 TaxID=1357935 RepID=UPI0019153120|nr:hypothetical protein [Pseudanabaena sp. lw0831]GBO52896.1 hypothetical protein APA_697 [Pseudanabaena sp. lw0831]